MCYSAVARGLNVNLCFGHHMQQKCVGYFEIFEFWTVWSSSGPKMGQCFGVRLSKMNVVCNYAGPMK